MTANTITEYSLLNLRTVLALALEELDALARDVKNSDETPQGAAARVNAEIAKINFAAK